MKRTATSLFSLALLAGCQGMPETASSKAQVEAATQSWITALNSCDVQRILPLYDKEAVLWPTTSRDIANSPDRFTITRDGKPIVIPARFSFTYRRTGGLWLIVDHHSSGMPAAPR